MNLGRDNPELYNELTRKGIVKYIDNLVDRAGFQVGGTWLEAYEALVETLQNSIPANSLYDELHFLAHKEINSAEADYWSGLIDAAKVQHKRASRLAMRIEPPFPNHRWSSWPGAICHYCGQPDSMEVCLAGCSYNDGDNIQCPNHPATICPATTEQKLAVDNYMNPDPTWVDHAKEGWDGIK